jgi:hypothetical protein
MTVVVEHYTATHIDNPNPAGETSGDDFWEVYEGLEEVCRHYGPTGPGDVDCDLYLVDDQYNDELYHYLQIYNRSLACPELLHDLMRALKRYPGWGIGVSNIRFAYLLIFESKLMVTGWPFAGCDDVETVAAALSSNLWGVKDEIPDWTDESFHREQLLQAEQCGCYTCCHILRPEDIQEWADPDADGIGRTAICPCCGQQTVIAPTGQGPLSLAKLIALSELAFGPILSRLSAGPVES